MGFSGFMSEIEDEREQERLNANLLRLAQGMQTPTLIHPVVPKDDNARKAGCKCNHRSSQPSGKHHPDCLMHRSY